MSLFLVNVLLARWLGPEDYGAFVVAYSWFLLPENFYEAILVERCRHRPARRLGGGRPVEK